MRRNRHWTVVIAAATVIALGAALGAAGEALARGPRGGRGDMDGVVPPPAPTGHYNRRVLDELIYPCQTACGDTHHACMEGVDSAIITCADSDATCAALITTAQATCAAGRRTQACWDATKSLDDCVQACADAQASAITTCNTDLQACVAACNVTP